MGRSTRAQRKNTYVDPQKLSGIEMAWHKDQQSLILNEMMVARRKLEEENNKLREELEDAEKTVESLSIYLEELQERTPASSNSRVNWRELYSATKRKARKRGGDRKQTFKNPLLGGKRLFKKSEEEVNRKKWPREVVIDKAREQVKPVVRSRRQRKAAAAARASGPSTDMVVYGPRDIVESDAVACAEAYHHGVPEDHDENYGNLATVPEDNDESYGNLAVTGPYYYASPMVSVVPESLLHQFAKAEISPSHSSASSGDVYLD